MVTNGWVTTWTRSAARASGIEPTPYALKALALWNKSTPTEPWTINPVGIPASGYARRMVPGTKYALFNKYSEFNDALAKFLSTPAGMEIKTLLQSGDSTVKLWRAIHDLDWPAAKTESDWPELIHDWIGEEYRALLNIKPKSSSRSTGTVGGIKPNEHLIVNAQRRMVTAAQTKLDLTKAIGFITQKAPPNGRHI
jgi:hypothetical protein